MTPCREEEEEGEKEEELSRIPPTPVGISLFTPVQSGRAGPLSHRTLLGLVPIKSPYTSDLISWAAGPGEDQAGSLGSLKAPSLLLGKLFSGFTRVVCLLQISGERGRAG